MSQRITNQTRVYLPKVILEKSSDVEMDIAGETFDDFKARFPRCTFKVLNKVNSGLSNRKLYEKGYLKNYVEDYLGNPLSKKFEMTASPN